ncbi:MAG: hypothetical protein LBR07_00060 [Puniceicoccales bacterium]|nr:hypothetical protein [Puniceicoccales bacterium]
MSPLSVAQYLAPEHPPFDLVIFDEASQIPVWDAAGAIARGTQLIVVGDPRQLPPTNFFNATTGINGTGDDFDWPADADSTDADGTVIYAPDGKIVRVKGGAGSATGDAVDALPPLVPADLVDLESILDELLASSIPIRRLRWHYRSRREALITFSNRHYYAGDLFTFPSPETGRAGLALHYLPNARYDRAKSRTNLAEAQALVAELTRRLLAHEAVPAPVPPVSYGVVTFSVAQQELVENLLDAVRREHPELERWFGDTPPVEGEPVFVKNLENVQGDERDVVLFSVCYGPDADGRVALNFGPLNRAGGERRLNVAVTRAKREMVVFTSMRSDQIDTSRVSARGVRDLREFLRFCEEGGERGVGGWEREIESGEQGAESGEQEKSAEDKNESTAAGAAPPEVAASEATRLIGAALRRRGYDVRHRVGCSDYRLDIGVVDPRDPSRFLLGIECDGDAYRSAGTARDRDKLRHEVLTGLGWRLHRLWLLDWWNAPDAEFTKLLATLDTAKATRQ